MISTITTIVITLSTLVSSGTSTMSTQPSSGSIITTEQTGM